MLAAQHLTRTSDTCLHLVGDEQHLVLLTQVVALLQITLVRNEHTCLALNRLSDECAHFLAMLLQRLLERLRIVVRNADETRSQWSVVSVRTGVVAHGNHRYSTSVEVTATAYNLDLVVRNSFLHSTPAASQLQSGLNTFGTGIHWQHAIVAKEVVHELFILAECIAVECARCQTQHVSLVLQRLHDFRMAVTLVNSRIRREEVEVFLAFYVPYIDTLTFVEHHWQRMIVVSTVALFHVHQLLALGFHTLALCLGWSFLLWSSLRRCSLLYRLLFYFLCHIDLL